MVVSHTLNCLSDLLNSLLTPPNSRKFTKTPQSPGALSLPQYSREGLLLHFCCCQPGWLSEFVGLHFLPPGSRLLDVLPSFMVRDFLWIFSGCKPLYLPCPYWAVALLDCHIFLLSYCSCLIDHGSQKV